MATPSGTRDELLAVEEMSGQRQVWKPDDDWTGISDYKKRKQRQNRLNQRAWRQRRAATKKNTQSAGAGSRNTNTTSSAAVSPDIPSATDNAPYSSSCPSSSYLPQGTPNHLTGHGTLSKPGGSAVAEPGYSAVMLFTQPDQQRRARDFIRSARANHFCRVAVPRQLCVLIKLNVMDALAHNATLLGISPQYLCDEDALSPFSRPSSLLSVSLKLASSADALHCIADEDDSASSHHQEQQRQSQQEQIVPPSLYPASLFPTPTQCAVSHHPWIDLLPFPAMRDRLLLEIEAGTVDEDELCADMFEDQEVTGRNRHRVAASGGHSSYGDGSSASDMEHHRRSEISDGEQPAALVIWGDASDPGAWEATLPFLRKYWFVVAGSPTLLEATNQWRARRGEALIRW